MATVNFSAEDVEFLLKGVRQILREELNVARQVELKERLYSPAEACKVFKPAISKPTLSNWTADGRIPMQKIGGPVWYKYSDLIEAGAKLVKYKK